MEMFQYGFMQRALIAGIAMAVLTPVLGLFLILRKQSLLADTLSHVSLVGVALGLLWQINPTFSTLGVVIIAALSIEWIGKSFKGFSEISVAILMSGGMALALILMTFQSGKSLMSVEQFLFGSIIVITKEQVYLLVALAIAVLVAYGIFQRPLYVLTFDEDTAHTAGLPVSVMSSLFTVLTGVVISVMMPIAGALLVSAIMILPASIAIRLSRSFMGVISLGMVISTFGIVSGLITSYQLDTPPGATIAMIFIAILLLTLIGERVYQWLNQLMNRS